MNAKYGKASLIRALCILVLFTLILGTGWVFAANAPPFNGHWQAQDLDGSAIQLNIGGPPNGPFSITSTDNYISFCEGGPGIMRGEGLLNENDPYLLEADLQLVCFTTGNTLSLHITFQYHPSTNMLSSNWNGRMIIWSRTGPPQEPPQPLELRINYGHDWVESFYPAGHTAWVTVTESDGISVRATAEVKIESKEYWDGESGFQTGDALWIDGDGNPMDSPPDIQPYDWVYGWVDNGASAQVQIGEISGVINFEDNMVTGTINADWIPDEVGVECFPWGAPDPQPDLRYDAVLTDNAATYQCSWGEDWKINLGQDVGVGYISPDGHWVANAFNSYARIIASESGDWFWTTDFNYTGEEISVAIYASKGTEEPPLWEGSVSAGEGGFIYLNIEDHGVDFQPGTYLIISDSSAVKGLVLEPISIHTFNTLDDYMAGTAPFGREVLVGAGLQDYQDTIWVNANEEIEDDPDTGGWFGDFSAITDITEDMREWSWAQIFDEDWDTNEGSNPPRPEIRAWTASNRVEGYQWPLGSEISLYINDFETPLDIQTVTEGDENWTHVEFDLHGWVLEPGQEIWMIGGGTEKFHTILPVSITDVDAEANIVYGGSTPGESIVLCIYDGGCDPPIEIFDEDEDGAWQKDYNGIFDITPDLGMDATEFDDDGDGTSYEYWVPWFVVPADAEWINSGLHLTMESTLTIEVYGEAWTAIYDYPDAVSGPDGQAYTCYGDCALEGAPYGALVGKIGENGEPFFIGSYQEVTAATTGDLYLAANDNLGYYYDNAGRYLIYIRDLSMADPHWGAVFTLELEAESLSLGGHSYFYNFVYDGGEGASGPVGFEVSMEAPSYDGFVLLRTHNIQAFGESGCQTIAPLINVSQLTRFLFGWVTDDTMPYEDAVTFFDNMAVTVSWDGGEPVPLAHHEIVEYVPGEIQGYFCSFTGMGD